VDDILINPMAACHLVEGISALLSGVSEQHGLKRGLVGPYCFEGEGEGKDLEIDCHWNLLKESEVSLLLYLSELERGT
jgi:hypothetical protein